MRILHLFSNTKLTGPAEPVLNLCASLKSRGYDVMFACCTSSKAPATVLGAARQRGLEPITDFRLSKHLNIRNNLHDVRRLSGFLREVGMDIVHTHLDNDHLVGGGSSRRTGKNTLVIRSYYGGDGMRSTLRNHYLLRWLTDGLIVASESARASIVEKFDFPEERTWVVPGAVDTSRFSPSRISADLREKFGLKEDDFVLGVVARIQPHRRFDVLFEAMKKVSKAKPNAKLLILGRGTRMKQVAVEPVERMRLGDCVIFAGYQGGQDYVDTLASFDAMIYMMPGSDGTCRAVREAMAMGKPVIAARRGMLPEIVDHGVNGLVIDDTPDTMAEAIVYLAENRETLASLSEQAAKKAREKFRLDVQARSVGHIYEHVMKLGRLSRSKRS